MGETDYHLLDIIKVLDSLRVHYDDEPNVCVSGNVLIFYEPGNKRKHVAPDTFMVFGVPKRICAIMIWSGKKARHLT